MSVSMSQKPDTVNEGKRAKTDKVASQNSLLPVRSCAMHVFLDITSYDHNNRPYVTHAYNHLTVTNVTAQKPAVYKHILAAMTESVTKLLPPDDTQTLQDASFTDENTTLSCLCDEHDIVEDRPDRPDQGMDVTSNRIKNSEFATRVNATTCWALKDRLRDLSHKCRFVRKSSESLQAQDEIPGETTNEYSIHRHADSMYSDTQNLFLVRVGNFAMPFSSCTGPLNKNIVSSLPSVHIATRLYEHDIKITGVCSKGAQFKPYHFVVNGDGETLALDRATHLGLFGHVNAPLQRYKHQWIKALNMNHTATYKELALKKPVESDRQSFLTRYGALVCSPLHDDNDKSFLVTFCVGNCKWNTTADAWNTQSSLQ